MVSLKLDRELLEACRKAVARDSACGEAVVDPDCEHYAQVEAHEMIQAYLCYAKTPCGVESNCAPAPTNVGQRICAELESVCTGDLYEDWCADMDVAAAWMRPDVRSAVDVCFAREYCTDMQACVDKWVGLVWQLD